MKPFDYTEYLNGKAVVNKTSYGTVNDVTQLVKFDVENDWKYRGVVNGTVVALRASDMFMKPVTHERTVYLNLYPKETWDNCVAYGYETEAEADLRADGRRIGKAHKVTITYEE